MPGAIMEHPYLSMELIIRRYFESYYMRVCIRILRENRMLFKKVQGSSFNHQAWPGGYHDHITETLNIAIVLYRTLNGLRPLPFPLSDALLVLFLHDIEKPWKYEVGEDGLLYIRTELESKNSQHEFKMNKIADYGLVLPEEIRDAIRHTEGERNSYSSKKRSMSPLAAFCHMCDVWSARGWYGFPSADSDPWKGAERSETGRYF